LNPTHQHRDLTDSVAYRHQNRQGLMLGFIGVLIFSISLPATRMALAGFDFIFIGLGRAFLAAFCALIILVLTKQALPARQSLPGFLGVIFGVVIGFPILSTIALRDTPASHGAVIMGLLPLATALFGFLRGGERPSVLFWLFSILGSLLVICFAVLTGGGDVRPSDMVLLASVLVSGWGYAEGGILARTYGGWQVICWSLVGGAPILLLLLVLNTALNGLPVWSLVPLSAWFGFLYLSFFSMLIGFFAWYKGLAMGGISRVGQLQLIQPFLTIMFSSLLTGEPIEMITIGFALAVILCVALGRRASVKMLGG
jgi:drug/metabolite transporter (DMT)-like permease